MNTTYRNGRLFRAGRFEVADFEVIDGRIAGVSTPSVPATNRQPNSGAIDLGGRFVIPGLIDAHAHLVLRADAERFEPLTSRVLKGVRNAKEHLASGVTSVRDAGGPGRITVELKQAIDLGFVEGPRTRTSGSFVCIPGGHVSYWGREVSNTEEARRAVREQHDAGADFIKIMASGGVADKAEDPNSAQFTPVDLRAICDEARALGTYVAAHAHPPSAIRLCIEAGVRTIEHASFIDEAGIEAALRANAIIVPTFIVYSVIAESSALPKEQRDQAARLLDSKIVSFLAAVEAGVRWGVGTDAGTYMPSGQLWREISLLHDLGIRAEDVLQAATVTNAEVLRDDQIGQLEVGRWADAVVLDSDPTHDIDTLAEPSMVIKGGQIVNPELTPTTPLLAEPQGERR